MNSKRKNQTSQSLTRILSIAFLALSLGVLLVSNAIQVYRDFQFRRESAYSKLELITSDASQMVSTFFEEKFSALETTVSVTNPTFMSTLERESTLDSLLGLQPSFRQLSLLNENDRLTASASRLSQLATEPVHERLTSNVMAQIRQGNNYISPIYIDDATSEPLVVMAVPVQDIFGDYQGTLAAEVNLKFIWDLVGQLDVGETGYAYVVDDTGRLIAYKDTARVLRGENVSNLEEVHEFIESLSEPEVEEEPIYNHEGLEGSTVLTTFEALGTPPWAVLVEMPIQEAYLDGILSQGLITILYLLGIAGLASFVGLFMARRLSSPLTSLTNTANRVAEGELGLQTTASGTLEVESLAIAFNTMTSQLRNLIGNLEERVVERTSALELANQRNERRARQFEATAQVARAITTNQDLETLLNNLVYLIGANFEFYHVGIFLLDENKDFAVLHAANSAGGQRMLEREHKLRVGQAGIVGNVTALGKPRIALDVGDDAAFFNNPDLPDTHSEMALPLRVADEVIGALDVQSTESNAFQQEDIEVLSTLADQVTIAIQNARSYEITQNLLKEAQRVSGTSLSESRQVLQTEDTNLGYMTSGQTLKPIEKSISSAHIKKAIASKTTVKEGGASATLAVPVRVRGEVIGVIDVRVPTGHEWEQDEVDITEAVAERLSLALESAMLLKATQRRAEIERVTADISGKIGATTQFDSILRTAAEELSRVLGGSEVLVQIQSLESSNGSGN